ncbi:MAG: ATP-binding protein [Candidatus Zeuxoniibacter abyssi]|nr:MAG: ATP-binding protein [Candidatus Persebacteraceae bacterium AB1(2)]
MKTIASFANNKGGHIVFGVKDRPRELVGLTDNDFEEIDEQEITEILNSYFSPEISLINIQK